MGIRKPFYKGALKIESFFEFSGMAKEPQKNSTRTVTMLKKCFEIKKFKSSLLYPADANELSTDFQEIRLHWNCFISALLSLREIKGQTWLCKNRHSYWPRSTL